MRHKTRNRPGRLLSSAVWLGAFSVFATSATAVAQYVIQRPADPNQREAFLVRQDKSECSGSDVANNASPSVVGTIWAARLGNGNTDVKVAITAKAHTTYRASIKCVRPLGDVATDDDGVANVTFTFPTNLAGPVYSFELAAEGPSSGDRFQSGQIDFR
jgi:hypothetical protein